MGFERTIREVLDTRTASCDRIVLRLPMHHVAGQGNTLEESVCGIVVGFLREQTVQIDRTFRSHSSHE